MKDQELIEQLQETVTRPVPDMLKILSIIPSCTS